MATRTIPQESYLTRHVEKTLGSSDDLDTFIGRDYEGVYYIGGTLPANCPAKYSHMLVLGVGNAATIQVVFDFSHGWFRGYAGSPATWSEWKEISYGEHRKGTTYSNINFECFGVLTSAGTLVRVSCPISLDRSLSTVSVTAAKAYLRTPAGTYVGSSAFNILPYLTAAKIDHRQSCLVLEFTKTDGWGITNNVPLAGEMVVTFTPS